MADMNNSLESISVPKCGYERLDDVIAYITSPDFCKLQWNCVTMAVGTRRAGKKKGLMHVHRTSLEHETIFDIKYHRCKKRLCDHEICKVTCPLSTEPSALANSLVKRKKRKRSNLTPNLTNIFAVDDINASYMLPYRSAHSANSKNNKDRQKPSCVLYVYVRGKKQRVSFQLHPEMELFLARALDKIEAFSGKAHTKRLRKKDISNDSEVYISKRVVLPTKKKKSKMDPDKDSVSSKSCASLVCVENSEKTIRKLKGRCLGMAEEKPDDKQKPKPKKRKNSSCSRKKIEKVDRSTSSIKSLNKVSKCKCNSTVQTSIGQNNTSEKESGTFDAIERCSPSTCQGIGCSQDINILQNNDDAQKKVEGCNSMVLRKDVICCQHNCLYKVKDTSTYCDNSNSSRENVLKFNDSVKLGNDYGEKNYECQPTFVQLSSFHEKREQVNGDCPCPVGNRPCKQEYTFPGASAENATKIPILHTRCQIQQNENKAGREKPTTSADLPSIISEDSEKRSKENLSVLNNGNSHIYCSPCDRPFLEMVVESENVCNGNCFKGGKEDRCKINNSQCENNSICYIRNARQLECHQAGDNDTYFSTSGTISAGNSCECCRRGSISQVNLKKTIGQNPVLCYHDDESLFDYEDRYPRITRRNLVSSQHSLHSELVVIRPCDPNSDSDSQRSRASIASNDNNKNFSVDSFSSDINDSQQLTNSRVCECKPTNNYYNREAVEDLELYSKHNKNIQGFHYPNSQVPCHTFSATDPYPGSSDNHYRYVNLPPPNTLRGARNEINDHQTQRYLLPSFGAKNFDWVSDQYESSESSVYCFSDRRQSSIDCKPLIKPGKQQLIEFDGSRTYSPVWSEIGGIFSATEETNSHVHSNEDILNGTCSLQMNSCLCSSFDLRAYDNGESHVINCPVKTATNIKCTRNKSSNESHQNISYESLPANIAWHRKSKNKTEKYNNKNTTAENKNKKCQEHRMVKTCRQPEATIKVNYNKIDLEDHSSNSSFESGPAKYCPEKLNESAKCVKRQTKEIPGQSEVSETTCSEALEDNLSDILLSSSSWQSSACSSETLISSFVRVNIDYQRRKANSSRRTYKSIFSKYNNADISAAPKGRTIQKRSSLLDEMDRFLDRGRENSNGSSNESRILSPISGLNIKQDGENTMNNFKLPKNVGNATYYNRTVHSDRNASAIFNKKKGRSSAARKKLKGKKNHERRRIGINESGEKDNVNRITDTKEEIRKGRIWNCFQNPLEDPQTGFRPNYK